MCKKELEKQKKQLSEKKNGFCLYLETPDPALNGGEDIFI